MSTEICIHRTRIGAPARDMFAWHAFEQLTPPRIGAILVLAMMGALLAYLLQQTPSNRLQTPALVTAVCLVMPLLFTVERGNKPEAPIYKVQSSATVEETTWYSHNMWPASYWRLWSDYIIHKIHMRVLTHIKHESEGSSDALKEQPLSISSCVLGENGKSRGR